MLKNDNKLEIYRDDKHLGLSFRWHSPSAYFLAFFALVWNAFLVSWYSTAFVSGAPIMAFIFPLVHVAFGFFTGYTALAAFLNKTFIDVYEGNLYVEHKPLPWWKGKKAFNTEDIEQVFVKEKISNNKNGTSKSYSLWVLFKNQKEEQLLNVGNLTSSKAKEIENHLEDFLSISDRPVKGEFGAGAGIVRQARKRRLKDDFPNRSLNFLYHCTEKDIIEMDKESLAVLSVSQYDWNNGETDKLLQLFDENKEEKLLHIVQNKAILSAYLEKVIPITKTGFVKFDVNRPIPLTIVQDTHFSFKEQKTGLAFNSSMNGHVSITQWLYEDKSKNQSLRVVDYEGQLSYYLGEKVEAERFGNTLDLEGDLPEKAIDDYNNNWDKEDLI